MGNVHTNKQLKSGPAGNAEKGIVYPFFGNNPDISKEVRPY
jgi:hypothetical protein